MTLTIGIDIGGTKIAGAMVAPDGRIVLKTERPTQAHLGAGHVLDEALGVTRELLSSMDGAHVTAIGVGAGGVIDCDRGVVLFATDILPGWTGTDLKTAFSIFGLATAFDNDVNALAAGECRFGVAKGQRCVVFVALGTGVGGAVVFNGKVHHGANWSAGELGHVIFDPSEDAWMADDGRRGTLEAYTCGSALAGACNSLLGASEARQNGRQVAQNAQLDPGGPDADAIRRTGERLGIGLVSIASILDPDMIVIGGGLGNLGDMLLNPARDVFVKRALPSIAKCPIVRASLASDASVVGAAALAM